MKKIASIIECFDTSISEIEKSNLTQLLQLKKKINRTKNCLNELRREVLLNSFDSPKKEIYFFKHQKPYVKGRLIFYLNLNGYLHEKPKGSKSEQRKFVNLKLSEISKEHCRHIDFINYYKLEESKNDKTYFLRGEEQLELFIDNTTIFEDPEFSTLRDHLASKVVAYDLLIKFYEKQLESFKKKNSKPPIKEVRAQQDTGLKWTASNTDLIEWILPLIKAKAINNGNVEMSKIVEFCKNNFDVDVGNIYNTFSQIKNRKKDPTKFLDKLKIALLKTIDEDLKKS
ncbi:RteC protein [Lutibacter agarilyticus]|uniref:RteC protein n=1 Tax=Lutibacter agarilyticus TaxID=1109740 RepID=A0A238Y552_9FLAO|nr:RteC domain-containing protein [Lutibacter agarilyticus]SNR66247.1 RteC protein [Lutibacter agarilyticus]